MILPSARAIPLGRWTLLAIALASIAWAIIVAVSGGVLLNTSWGRISSRNPTRPFLIGGAALLVYIAAFRHYVEEDLRRLSYRHPSRLAAVLVAAALVVGIRYGTFAASGSDASGYISQAEMWLRGELTTIAPEWAHDAPWDGAGWSSAPLGYRSAEISYVLVPTYSPGLPMAMALFQAIGGRPAVYYVVPIFGALTILATYLLGARFAGPWAGFLGAFLLLTSPTFLIMLVQPMSDVPAAALWAVALYGAWRGGTVAAAGAGLAAALAIVTRPNIAPLAGVVALIVAVRSTARVRELLAFALAVVPGALTIALLNAYWYGSPLRSGYGPLSVIYSIDRVWPNLLLYGGWLLQSQTPFILVGLAAPFVVPSNRTEARLLLLTAVVFPAVLLALYVPYFVFEYWTYLRFLLPAFPPLLAATGAVVVTMVRRANQKGRAVALTALIVIGLALYGMRYSGAFTLEIGERRFTRVAEYVKQLPADAVYVSLLHSGSIRYYTGRDVLRWELVDPASFDTAVDYLRARGHDVYLVADDGDFVEFKTRMANTRAVRDLDRGVPVDLGGTRIFAMAGSRQLPRPVGG